VDIAFDIAGGKLQSLDTSVTGKLTLNATAQAIFTVALEGGASVPLMPPVTKVFGGMVWAVPVWVQVKMELEAGYAYNADASGSIQTTVAMEKDLSFHVNLRNDQWTSGGENPAIVRSAEPLSWQLEGTANVNVNIQPKLTVLVYSLAGLWVDINPYLEFDGSYQANPLAYDLGVYGGLSSTLGVACEIPGITTPEPWTLFDQRWLLWSNSNQNDVKPAFVADFRNQTVARSKSFALSAAVSGSPAPQYKWLFNGGRIPGETSSWYAIASAQPGHAGTYTVQAYNSAGSAEASCQVSVTDAEPVPQTDFDLPLRATHGTLNQTQPFGDFFPEMFGFHSAEDWKYVNVTADNQYVYSAGPGRVVWISDWSDTRGKVVAIEHTGTFAIPRKDYVCPTTGQTYTCPTATLTKVMSVYVHLTNVQVYSNQIVNVNTLLGKYMNAGTGPHLHFEIRLPGTIPSASWSMFQPQSNWYTYLDPADATYKYTGYYLNLQQMVDAGVDAGVREPLSFIYANSHRAVSTKFTVGQAINAPDAVNVRILPSYLVWEGIKSVSANTTGVILDASATGFKNGVAADGYSWWYVQFGAVSGWCAEACLKTTVPVDPAPSGMVLIPAGTNTGTDPDFGAYSLTVAAFYMDATEVTKAKWDEVYTWALAHGYTFAHAGSGKAANHPVQTVSWYDCVKWCNARSEKEGKTPCYNLSTWACNFAANGYRLPTNTEWEYAARGGLSSKRFPWGDIIDHTRANYHAYWSGGAPYFAYDQGYQGYDTRYATGGEPYTSPAGAFAASGYGLYDMAGNVWEWCNDSSGLSRYVRGGSWNSRANYARCGYSNSWYGPGSAFSTYGFRTVCR
jgi:formylglycine-generating enzyme required for sulfatase activity